MTITLTPAIEAQIVRDAARLGKSPEDLALARLSPNAVKFGRPRAQRSDAVKLVRQKLKITQIEMANLLCISKSTLIHLETESVLPSDATALKSLKRLARRHGVAIKGGAAS